MKLEKILNKADKIVPSTIGLLFLYSALVSDPFEDINKAVDYVADKLDVQMEQKPSP